MIEQLSVKNFKSWADLPALDFGKVTAIFGANSTGKTSLIQLLLMLKQTAASRDRRLLNFGGTERDYVDLGSYEDVVYGHDLEHNVEFRLAWTPSAPLSDEEFFDEDWFRYASDLKKVMISVSVGYVDGKVVIKKITYEALDKNEHVLDMTSTRLKDGRYGLASGFMPDFRQGDQLEPTSFYNVRWGDALSDEEISALASKNWFEIGVLFNGVPVALERTLESIYYLGPLRDYPHREYRWTGEKPTSVGMRGEYAIQAMLAQLATKQAKGHETEDLLASANEWLRRFGLAERVDLQLVGGRLYELSVQPRGYVHKANIMDVGFGVSQVLPIIIMAHFVPEGSMIILEQPEIHLHPRVQTELADLFLEVALKRNVQFFIESHSEHLLMRLQRRLAERQGAFSQLTTNDVRLYFCKREAEASVLESLELDDYGRIKNWPKDFFGDPVTERRAMTEAMLARQTAK